MIDKTRGYRLFTVVNTIVVGLLALICFLPILHVFAVSLSDRVANAAGLVNFWPVNINIESYRYVWRDSRFLRAFGVSVSRVIMGGGLNVLMTILCAYPLSKPSATFRTRTVYVWFFLFASLFGGGLVPTYMVVRSTGLLNSFWALVIPSAVPIGNIVLMLNFFRNLPREIEEAAIVDGAGHVRILAQIYVPLSKASIATVTLFSAVGHWNSWFDGMIYMLKPAGYPLATYLHTLMTETTLNVIQNVTDMESLNQLLTVTNESLKSAQLFIGMVPILCVYPFLQRYFTKGIVIGSVKG